MKISEVSEDFAVSFTGAAFGNMFFDSLTHTVIASLVALATKEMAFFIYKKFFDRKRNG